MLCCPGDGRTLCNSIRSTARFHTDALRSGAVSAACSTLALTCLAKKEPAQHRRLAAGHDFTAKELGRAVFDDANLPPSALSCAGDVEVQCISKSEDLVAHFQFVPQSKPV